MNGMMIDLIKMIMPMMVLRGEVTPDGEYCKKAEYKFMLDTLLKAEEALADTLDSMEFPKPEGEHHDLERAIAFIEKEANQYDWSKPV